MEDEDHALVEMARDGHPHAFAELVARHKSRILAMASRFARNSHETDDLAQEIFIQAWRGLAKFRGDAPFSHWLNRLAVRGCYQFLRRHRQRREREVSLDALASSSAGGLPEMASDPVDAARAESAADAARLLHSALRQLKPKDRLVITLLELEEKSVRETATLTGWSESNVKVRAHRARVRLKQILTLSK
jgi:RNA polymerase sigma-70 factor (ECF subfamily)